MLQVGRWKLINYRIHEHGCDARASLRHLTTSDDSIAKL